MRAVSTTHAEVLLTTTTTLAARVNPRVATSAADAALVPDFARGLRLERTRSCSRITRVEVPQRLMPLRSSLPCDAVLFYLFVLFLFFLAVELFFPTQAFFYY
jgi:hypothetical protein